MLLLEVTESLTSQAVAALSPDIICRNEQLSQALKLSASIFISLAAAIEAAIFIYEVPLR